MDKMNKAVFSYIKTHTMLIMTLVVGIFMILAGGEYLLYRRIMQLNQMTSEGLFQLKESKKAGDVSPTIGPMVNPTKPTKVVVN